MYEGSFKKYISFYATKHFVLFFRNISFCGLYIASLSIYGIEISKDASSYADFCDKMKKMEAAFVKSITQ